MPESLPPSSRNKAALVKYTQLNKAQSQGERAVLDLPSRDSWSITVRRLQLRESYRYQRTRLLINGNLFDLVVAPAAAQLRAWGPGCGPAEVSTKFPFGNPVFVVGCWPTTAKLTPQETVPAVALCRATAVELGLRHEVVLNVDRNGRWLEAALLITDSEPDMARKLARRLGQRYLLGWYPHRIDVIDSRRRRSHQPTAAWGLVAVTRPTCPVLLGADETTRCADPGGPWVGASIHLSAFWSAQRTLATDLLGCGLCRIPGALGELNIPETRPTSDQANQRPSAEFFDVQRITIPTRTHGWQSDWPDEWVPAFGHLGPPNPKREA